jgi:hypothetical protein
VWIGAEAEWCWLALRSSSPKYVQVTACQGCGYPEITSSI